MSVNRLAGLLQPDGRSLAHLAAAVALVALVGIAWEAARITWMVWPSPPNAQAPTRALEAGARGASDELDVASLASLHLFGEPPQDSARQQAPIDAPETNLNLQLRGILFDSGRNLARAIIAPDGGPDDIFRIGDELPGGASVEAIYADRVILRRNGRHEALKLPETPLGQAAFSATETADEQSEAAGEPRNDSLSALRERVVADPTTIQQYLQPVPAQDAEGNLIGFRLERAGDPALFEATGLQPGDLVTAIGGISLTSQEAAFEAMQQLGNADRLTLTVTRNGRSRELSLNFQR